MFHELRPFKPDEPSRTQHELLDPGDMFAVIASTHGDSGALAEVFGIARELGVRYFFHTGDITGECRDPAGCLAAFGEKGTYAILGNHDVLCLGTEYVHTYEEKMIKAAELSWEVLSDGDKSTMANLPVKVETPYFSIVHESVAVPYYAKRTKRRRRSHGWDVGSAADENTTAVCFGKIDRPHFIGSDHMAYVLHSEPLLTIDRPGPDQVMVLPKRSVVSVPSVAFSRDDRYDCGFITGRIGEQGEVEVRFHSIAPRTRTTRWEFFGG